MCGELSLSDGDAISPTMIVQEVRTSSSFLTTRVDPSCSGEEADESAVVGRDGPYSDATDGYPAFNPGSGTGDAEVTRCCLFAFRDAYSTVMYEFMMTDSSAKVGAKTAHAY